MKLYLTGGTGLLGSHFVELAVAEGAEIIALVRSTSNTAFLDSMDVAGSTGDLQNQESLARGMVGCDAVVHAASPVGGWGSPSLYEQYTVNGVRNVIAAMMVSGVKKLIHISTISVYGLDPIQGEPVCEANGVGHQFLPRDYYGRAKVKAEKLVREAHEAGGIQATVLQPGWIYGPRDKNSYGRMSDMMKRGMAVQVGDGNNQIPLVYVGNVAHAMWLALNQESSDYRVYLCAQDRNVTQNDYLASVKRAIGAKRNPPSFPKSVLLKFASVQESLSALFGYKIPVPLSRYVVHLLGSDWHFDQRHIIEDLGYSPPVSYAEGFAMTEKWYCGEI